VAGRQDQPELLAQQRLDVQARVRPAREVRVLVAEHEVERAERQRRQRRLGLGVLDLDAQRGVLGREPPQRRRQQVQARRLERRHAQGPGHLLGHRGEIGLRLLGARQQRVGVADQRLRGGREPHVAPGALEQRHARLLLELRELLRDGGGGVGERFGDGADRAAGGELAQQAQAAEVEHREADLSNIVRNFQWMRTIAGGTVPAVSRLGAAFVLVSACAFGVMPIFGKEAFNAGVTVTTLLVIRFAIASPVLWAGAWLRGSLPRVRGGVLARGLALGGVGYATQSGLYFLALERMDASVLSLILYSYPAMVTGAAILLRREPASRRRLAALVTATLGLVLVLAGSGAGAFDGLGALLGFGASLTYTTYILVSDAVTAHLEPLPLAALVSTGAVLTLLPFGLVSGTLDLGFAGEGWLWIALAAAISTVVAILLFFSGMNRVGPSTAAILSTLEPPTTVALAFLAFGEALGAVQLLGAVAVLAAAVIVNLPQPAAATPSP
jgi:drug/metabolite transporter (DMT)-like permease